MLLEMMNTVTVYCEKRIYCGLKTDCLIYGFQYVWWLCLHVMVKNCDIFICRIMKVMQLGYQRKCVIASVCLMTNMYNDLYIYSVNLILAKYRSHLFTSTLNCLVPVTALQYLHLCLYSNTNIIIIQFVYKACGINRTVVHLLRGRGQRALCNIRVPDGSQSFSQCSWSAMPSSPSSFSSLCNNPGELTVDSTCAMSGRGKSKCF